MTKFRNPPVAPVVPPSLPGQRKIPVAALYRETAREALARVSGYVWAARIVGRPAGPVCGRWVFTIGESP